MIPFSEPIAAQELPQGGDWIHEPKLPGWRIQIAKRPSGVSIVSRVAVDVTRLLSGFARHVKALPTPICSLDCLVTYVGGGAVLDEPIEQVLKTVRRDAIELHVLDLMIVDGVDIRNWQLRHRRARLVRLLDKSAVRPVPSFASGGEVIAAGFACVEEILSKDLRSSYISGPSDAWIKTGFESWK